MAGNVCHHEKKSVADFSHRIRCIYGNVNNVLRGKKSGAFTVMGDYPDANIIQPLKISSGRFINDPDIKEKRKVTVIGTKVHDILFEKGENPMDKYISVNGVFFKVI